MVNIYYRLRVINNWSTWYIHQYKDVFLKRHKKVGLSLQQGLKKNDIVGLIMVS